MIMNERLVSKIPDRNKWILLILGSVILISGVMLLIFQEDGRVGKTVILLGASLIAFTIIGAIRKVEIVGNCGISKAFLKKRLFYLSEIETINISPQNDRIAVSGADGTKIFDITRPCGCYEEIMSALAHKNVNIVKEKELEKQGKVKWLESICRMALYIVLPTNIACFLADDYSTILLGILLLVLFIWIFVISYMNDAEDVILLEEGELIDNAILVDYMDLTMGNAYPIFSFSDKRGEHRMYARTKMKMQVIKENMGKAIPVYYAPGKAMSVMIKEED